MEVAGVDRTADLGAPRESGFGYREDSGEAGRPTSAITVKSASGKDLPRRDARSGPVRELLLVPGLRRQHAGHLQAHRSAVGCGFGSGTARRSTADGIQAHARLHSLHYGETRGGAAAAAGSAVAARWWPSRRSTSTPTALLRAEHFRQVRPRARRTAQAGRPGRRLQRRARVPRPRERDRRGPGNSNASCWPTFAGAGIRWRES